MREIVLDTETTGLDPLVGHRLVEVACLELHNHLPTGRRFQSYLNPQRDVPEDARRVHGLTEAFLAGHPLFASVAEEFLDFLQDSPLVIHNADFDLGFLNAELLRAGRPLLARSRAIDTVILARQKFPGAPASLDALCKRFGIDNAGRTLHGALLDCQLLAEVYLELRGGRQPGLGMALQTAPAPRRGPLGAAGIVPRPPRPHGPSAEELARHEAMLAKLKNPLWRS